MHLLFVCTGNICRSAVAERLLTGWVGDLVEHLEVSSAGVAATPGRPMHRASARALEQLGGDPTGFTSRRLTAGSVQRADLVLTMTRQHRRTVLELAPRGLRRTFTLAEAAGLLPLADLAGLTSLPPALRAAELGLRLAGARARRPGRVSDDIPDPMGQDDAVHDAVAVRVAGSVRALADVLFDELPLGRLVLG
ncbi:arsenate reductase/protein-tyrosine-phosphatase family protein [Geodermatophilus sp. SYSU D01119]